MLYVVFILCLSTALGETPYDKDVVQSIFENGDTNQNGVLDFDEAWTEVMGFDSDGDGQVGKIEFTLTVFNTTTGTIEVWPDFFDAVDSNRDRIWDKNDARIFYNELDDDQNGLLSREEFSEIFRKTEAILGRNPSFDNYTDYQLGDADTNKDGQLTLEEGWDRLLIVDTNNDGMVEEDEATEVFKFSDFPQSIHDAVHKIFRGVDRNKDRNSDFQEFSTFFQGIDSNGDGYISRNTYATVIETMFARHGGDIRHFIRGPITFDTVGFQLADLNHDGFLTVDEAWHGLLTLDRHDNGCITFHDLALVFTDAYLPDLFDIVQKLDMDGNYLIDMSDVKGIVHILDKDGDQLLSWKEVIVYRRKIVDSICCKDLFRNSTSDHGFGVIDDDQDERISFTEAWQATFKFDRDGDEQISEQEFCDSLDAYTAPAGHNIFARFDIGNDGFLQKIDVHSFFTQVDSDSDGLVSPPEYISYMETMLAEFGVLNDYGFGAMDINKDGRITFSELERAKKKEFPGFLPSHTKEDYQEKLNLSKAVVDELFDLFSVKDGSFDYDDNENLFHSLDVKDHWYLTRQQYTTYAREVLAKFPKGELPDNFLVAFG